MIVNKFNSAILDVVPQYQEPPPLPILLQLKGSVKEHQHRLVMLQPSTHQQWCLHSTIYDMIQTVNKIGLSAY